MLARLRLAVSHNPILYGGHKNGDMTTKTHQILRPYISVVWSSSCYPLSSSLDIVSFGGQCVYVLYTPFLAADGTNEIHTFRAYFGSMHFKVTYQTFSACWLHATPVYNKNIIQIINIYKWKRDTINLCVNSNWTSSKSSDGNGTNRLQCAAYVYDTCVCLELSAHTECDGEWMGVSEREREWIRNPTEFQPKRIYALGQTQWKHLTQNNKIYKIIQ